MAADGSLQLLFIYIAALHDKLISDHDGWCFWQPQFGIFFGTILLIGLGCGLDFHLILFPQTGDDFSEMPSRLAARFIFENSYFQHDFLLFSKKTTQNSFLLRFRSGYSKASADDIFHLVL